MYKHLRNNDEIAMLLGHEIAHMRLGHTGSTPQNEYDADAIGGFYARNAGYNICKGMQFIVRFKSPDSKTHPASIKRYKKLGC